MEEKLRTGKDERLMFLLDTFLEGKEDCQADEQVLGVVPMDYVSAYLDTPDATETSAESTIRSKTEQLLDSFLSADHTALSMPDQTALPASAAQDETDDEQGQDDTEQLDDSYFTETLARIYLKQHRYDKALEIIRSLYLNFPNKSIYFADQIRYLEILVRINQKK